MLYNMIYLHTIFILIFIFFFHLFIAPIAPDSRELIAANSTYAIVNLNSWNNGGCPLINFNLQYKLKIERDYQILSTNLLPDQRNFLITDLRPATWYNLFITSYNEAGSTGAEYTFSTLTESGEPLPPAIPNNLEEIAQQLRIIMPTICAIIVMILILGIFCVMFKKRRDYHQAVSFTGK